MSTSNILSDPAWKGDVELPVAPATGASWPRMLVLEDETQERLEDWLFTEISAARVEKQPLIDDWKKWQKQYWAKPKAETKNWPFPKAANIVIPITAIAVEAVYARLINTLFAAEPFYSIRPKSAEWIEAAPQVEEWFQTEIENPNLINMYGFCAESLLEMVKLGTAVGKSGYEREVRKTIRQIGETDEAIWVETKNGASLSYVPLANFLIRMSQSDPQVAPWVGEEHMFTWTQLKRMVLSGQMAKEGIEEIKVHWNSTRSEEAGDSGEYHERIDELTKQEPIWDEMFNIQEVWCAFDVNGDGVDEEIVVDFHNSSQTILSIRYNWYDDLHRPYRLQPYFPVEGRAFGIGIGKQNEQFQEEITTIHRQRLDSGTLANMGMVALKKNSGYGPDEPVFPGKMWFFDDPKNDIVPFKLSEVWPSSFNNEQAVMAYQEKRTGVNEVILGQAQQGTPGTATGDLTRLAEGNKRFDLVLRGIRQWLGQLGIDLLANYQQFGGQNRHWLILGEDGAFVEQVLSLPPSLIRNGAIVEVTATSSITNRDAQQRAWLAAMQMLEKYYLGQINLAQLIGDQELMAQIAQMAMQASTEATRRMLETFDVKDAEKLLLLTGGRNGGPAAAPGSPVEGAPRQLSSASQPLGVGGVDVGAGAAPRRQGEDNNSFVG